MLSPQSLRNGETPPRINNNPPHHHFHSTVSIQKLRRFNTLILIFRLVSFCFCLAATIFMATNSPTDGGTSSSSPNWSDFPTLRVVLAVNAIVAVYSFAEMGASVWEILKGTTILPETVQVWFDFSHDQVFAYLLISAEAAGTTLVRTLREADTCRASSNSFCVQSSISIGLGYAGFLFLGFSSLLSGFRVVCFIINGSRFHL